MESPLKYKNKYSVILQFGKILPSAPHYVKGRTILPKGNLSGKKHEPFRHQQGSVLSIVFVQRPR